MANQKEKEFNIKEFDSQQLALMDQLKKDLLSLSLPDGADREEVEKAIVDIYANEKLDPPRFFWCESIWEYVAVRGLLYLLAVGEYEKVAELFEKHLTEPKWKRLWKSLKQQFGDLKQFVEFIQPEVEAFKAGEQPARKFGIDSGTYMDSLFKSDIQMQYSGINYEAQTQKLLGEQVNDRFELRAKLQLRRKLLTEYRSEAQGVVNSQWGLRALDTLIPGEFHEDFESQFDEETIKYFVELGSKYIKENDFFGLRAAFGASKEQPSTKQLFQPGLNDTTSLIREDRINLDNWFPVMVFLAENFDFDLEEKYRKDIHSRYILLKNQVDIAPHELLCLICEPPVEMKFNDRGMLHCPDGPAVKYRDGFEVYVLNGVTMPPYVVKTADQITVEKIEKEENVEVRRVMIQRYGIEKYIEDSGAREIDADEFGVLYKKEQLSDEPIVVVKVVNSTPEPDGSPPKHYFLRVPPYITTAKEAVAWTFDMEKSEYQPVVQS